MRIKLLIISVSALLLMLTAFYLGFKFQPKPSNSVITTNQNDETSLPPRQAINIQGVPAAKPAPSPKPMQPSESDNGDSTEQNTVEYKGYTFNADAIKSLRETRINGDSRAPVIGKHIDEPQATQEEIEDTDLYQAFETRKERQVYRAYVIAAKQKIAMLEKEIDYAKKKGMPKAQLEEGVQKLKGIKDMRDQLLEQYPGLLDEGNAQLNP